MKIELKPIIDQLTDAINLDKHHKVSALIDDDNNNALIGWCIVEVFDDGTIKPIDDLIYKDIKELLNAYL